MSGSDAYTPKFIREHPVCYFCGVAPTETRDHVPARVMFKGRQAPEGFVFPACKSCNAKDKASELVAAFHLHAMTENYAELKATHRGLRNNYPSALPDPFMTPGQKARALSARGITLPARFIGAAPIVRLSPEADSHFHRFACKLCKALYYRTMGRPVPADFRIVTHWTTADQPSASDTLDALVSIMPMLEVGARRNVDLGQQFYYRFNASSEHDVFAFTAGFSNLLFFTGLGGRDAPGLDFDKFLSLRSWREAS